MKRLAFLGPLFLLLPACGQAHDNQLSETRWKFVSIDGASTVSTEARIAFSGDRLSASAGCNTMGGTWRIDGDRLIADQLVQTEMWCENARMMEQERTLAALLAASPEFLREEERLTLRSAGHSARLALVK